MELIKRMTESEAKTCIQNINSNISNIRSLILDLYERQGWAALGYGSWRECVVAEFKEQQRYLYYQLEAARIGRNLCTIVQKTESIPEGQLRPLARLEPEQQKEAWQRAVETAPNGKVTADHVYKIVKEMEEPPVQQTNQLKEEDSDALFHLKRWWKKATKKDKTTFLEWAKKGEAS